MGDMKQGVRLAPAFSLECRCVQDFLIGSVWSLISASSIGAFSVNL